MPAALAAALLDSQRTVASQAGDGDFLMTGRELATATGHGMKRLVCIVIDNDSFRMIGMHQERKFPGRLSGSSLSNPDFAALAKAYGWASARVERTAGFEHTFDAALASERPTLIHLTLDVDVSTSRTTLSAIRAAAFARHGSP